MVEHRSRNRFSGLIPKEGGFDSSDFESQVQSSGRFGYLGGSSFDERPLQGDKFSKKEGKKEKRFNGL